jgi:hypothetical protein
LGYGPNSKRRHANLNSQSPAITQRNGMFEFQSLLKKNHTAGKLSFNEFLELFWRHATIHACHMPFVLPLFTLFHPSDSFYKTYCVSLMEIISLEETLLSLVAY